MTQHIFLLIATIIAPMQNPFAPPIDPSAERLDRAFVEWQFRELRDPDSANWHRTKDHFHATVTLKRGLLGKREWTGEMACYVLNGKNAYGAYTGYTPHAVMITDGGEVLVWEGMGASERGAMYRSYGQQIIDNYCS